MKEPNCTLIVGPSGCGKTYILLNEILTKEYYKHFDFIMVLCPTLWINETYLNWKYLESDSDVIPLSISAENLDSVIDFIIEWYSESKVAIIIDDMSNNNEQHINTNLLTYLAFSGRHHNFSLFVLSQKLNSIATGIRDNTTDLIFFRTHNKRSLKVLKEEFFGYLIGSDAEKVLLKDLSKSMYLRVKLTNVSTTNPKNSNIYTIVH